MKWCVNMSKRSNRNIIFDAIRRIRKSYSLPSMAEIAIELQNMGYDDVSTREIQKALAFIKNRQQAYRARRKRIDGSRRGQLAELLGLPGTSAPEIDLMNLEVIQ